MPRRGAPRLLRALPLAKLPGFGGKLGAAVSAATGAETAGDVALLPLDAIEAALGGDGGAALAVLSAARGESGSRVAEKAAPKSLMAAKSLDVATGSRPLLERWLSILADELAARLEADGRPPRTLALHYRCRGMGAERSVSGPAPRAARRPAAAAAAGGGGGDGGSAPASSVAVAVPPDAGAIAAAAGVLLTRAMAAAAGGAAAKGAARAGQPARARRRRLCAARGDGRGLDRELLLGPCGPEEAGAVRGGGGRRGGEEGAEEEEEKEEEEEEEEEEDEAGVGGGGGVGGKGRCRRRERSQSSSRGSQRRGGGEGGGGPALDRRRQGAGADPARDREGPRRRCPARRRRGLPPGWRREGRRREQRSRRQATKGRGGRQEARRRLRRFSSPPGLEAEEHRGDVWQERRRRKVNSGTGFVLLN